MELFKASFLTVVMRYYAMMFAIIFFTVFNMTYLGLIITLPLFLSAISGMSFKFKRATSSQSATTVKAMPKAA